MTTEQIGARVRINSAHKATRNAPGHDDDVPAGIDFAKGTRGRFFEPGAQLKLPVMSSSSPAAWAASCATRPKPLPGATSRAPRWMSSLRAGAAGAGRSPGPE